MLPLSIFPVNTDGRLPILDLHQTGQESAMSALLASLKLFRVRKKRWVAES